MARDISQRLQALKSRRSGTDRVSKLAIDEMLKAYADSATIDSYQKRSSGKPFTEYALGAMQEVGPRYTEISIETAQRVGNQVQKGLRGSGCEVELRLQGSVPANIHIRGYSDVDLLILRTDFLVYSVHGAAANAGIYAPTNRTTREVLMELRANSTKILKAKFPEAEVDTSGGKAVKISGASLARAVDVVPSHWFDSKAYQQSYSEAERGVIIYDNKAAATIENYPFKHIELLNLRDAATAAGLKKAIRLCKNVKCDAESDITLSSFEIASLMYHADGNALMVGSTRELGVLAEAQRFLDYLFRKPDVANALKVPDGSRTILDTVDKLNGLTALSLELDSLAKEVTKEQQAAYRLYEPTFDDARRVLRETYIPAK